MSIVVPDIACLREPRLLQPTRRPVGPVKVDQSVLSQPVGWAIFPDQSVSIEGSMWSQERIAIGDKTTTYPNVTNGNPGMEFTARTAFVEFQGYTLIPSGADFTIIIQVTPKVRLNFIDYILDINNGDLYVSTIDWSGYWTIRYPTMESGGALTYGLEYTLIVRRESTLVEFFTNGKKESNSGSHPGSLGLGSATVLRFNSNSYKNAGPKSHIPFAALIIGALSDSECANLGRDPYQFLIPA